MDLGCGDGILAAMILEEFPDSDGVLVDHSPPMLKAAETELAGFAGRIHLCEADYGQASWVESIQQYAPLDLVVSGFSVHHQPDASKRRLYGEIFELLRAGGMFINRNMSLLQRNGSQSCGIRSGWIRSTSLLCNGN